MSKHTGWIAVDLDRTLAFFDEWRGSAHIGEPIPAMLQRVKEWVASGREVRIFTARVYPLNTCVMPEVEYVFPHIEDKEAAQEAVKAVVAIQSWCYRHIGVVLPITNVKDMNMVQIYDDLAVRVFPNTGVIA